MSIRERSNLINTIIFLLDLLDQIGQKEVLNKFFPELFEELESDDDDFVL